MNQSDKPGFITTRTFMGSSNLPTASSNTSSPLKSSIPHRSLLISTGSLQRSSNDSIRVPFNENQIKRSNAGSILSLPPYGEESVFKSVLEAPSGSIDHDGNMQMRFHNETNEDENREDDDDDDEDFERDLIFNVKRGFASIASDARVRNVKVFAPDLDQEQSEKMKRLENKEKKMKYLILYLLLFFSTCSVAISSFPIFTCNNSQRICIPQLTIQLTDKSPAAKTALLTVREALKVLSYLAIDFGDADNDLLNNSLDDYYQSKVIDAFSVTTIYQLNFLGYCRLSTKKLEKFCMKSYGFDLLSVFVRDAGVQLGMLTKTNLIIMGDSFAIAYELAINGFNKLVNKEGKSNEYVDWAILLQKFSKGLGLLSFSQFVFDCTLLGLSMIMIILVSSKFSVTWRKVSAVVKKSCILIMTLTGFLNIMTSFLISSLTLVYTLKLKEVASNVGIANVTAGLGFILVWVSLALHLGGTVLVILLANLYRKRIL